MLNELSSLKGSALQAKDGTLGTVADFLFDDSTWKVRWLVADTGGWLTGRKVLIHPSAVVSVEPAVEGFTVALTKAQVEGSPDILKDRPISQQMQNDLYGYYGWSPLWSGGIFGAGMYGGMAGIATPVLAPSPFGARAAGKAGQDDGRGWSSSEEGDPNLRSTSEVTGYHVHASDGEIGHVQDFLVDEASWEVRYLVIDTSNWWFGQHVLISPSAVNSVEWSDRHIRLDISREQVKSSPSWSPAQAVDDDYERRLHDHYA
ncbi:PRC-barrel domain containing protein (plasmid) [Sphingomonas paeninsulae]|uniref:PRC-barrel domain containing protein n=1 Tax=Sphingomonas paeninsulae TaxID=2319844 RepID=A0A494T6S5_SPHPE|nr:PRC-barrel domain-containing protein [Sphingomonas paeninsulae]AYJ84570.1 PRC-barrel domain containing protein [Sphingomonas paeninsulae]